MEERTILELYTAKELMEMDGVYYNKIVNSKDYIPVKIRNSRIKYDFKVWHIKKDYSIKYIRVKDAIDFLDHNKRRKW